MISSPLQRVVLFLLLAAGATASLAQTVTITDKPSGLVAGTLYVPVVATGPVERLELLINGVRHSEAKGQAMTSQVNVGQYIRRRRMRALGYDANGAVVAEDEMVVNDPRPPFRVRLQAPPQWPESGTAQLHANVIRPAEIRVSAVDFYVGEEKIATAATPPYAATVDAAKFTTPV